MATVLTMGTFDLPHSGHMYLFQQCRIIAGEGGTVHVGLNEDDFIAHFKGKPPVQSWAERKAILSAVKYIDYIHATPGADAKPLIELVAPDLLVIGVDWAPPKDYYGQLQISQDYLLEQGIGLLYLDRMGDLSSTNLKERVRNA